MSKSTRQTYKFCVLYHEPRDGKWVDSMSVYDYEKAENEHEARRQILQRYMALGRQVKAIEVEP